MQNRVAVLQSLSGTGSLRLGAAFIAKFLPGTTVYVSNPTWGNHNNIFADAGVKARAVAAGFSGLSALQSAGDGIAGIGVVVRRQSLPGFYRMPGQESVPLTGFWRRRAC